MDTFPIIYWLLKLNLILSWFPITGCVPAFESSLENSSAPDKLLVSEIPTAKIFYFLQYMANSDILTAPSQIEYWLWVL